MLVLVRYGARQNIFLTLSKFFKGHPELLSYIINKKLSVRSWFLGLLSSVCNNLQALFMGLAYAEIIK